MSGKRSTSTKPGPKRKTKNGSGVESSDENQDAARMQYLKYFFGWKRTPSIFVDNGSSKR